MAVQSTVLLAQASRQGTFTTSTIIIPPAVLRIKLICNIALADKLAVGLQMSMDCQRSTDGGANWTSVAGITWTSYGPAGYPAGKDGVVNPDPSLSFNPSIFIGQQFRLVAVIPQPLSVGLTADITT